MTKSAGPPPIWCCPALSEHTMGQLMQMLMLATVVEGRLMGINPYGQPGVEAYKKNMQRDFEAGYGSEGTDVERNLFRLRVGDAAGITSTRLPAARRSGGCELTARHPFAAGLTRGVTDAGQDLEVFLPFSMGGP